MIYFVKNKKINNLIIIALVYFALHIFLIVITGRWWDDWCFYNQEDYALKKMAFSL